MLEDFIDFLENTEIEEYKQKISSVSEPINQQMVQELDQLLSEYAIKDSQ